MEAEINGASRPLPQPSREDEVDGLPHSNMLSQINAIPPRTPTKVSDSLYNTQITRSKGRNIGTVGGNTDSDDPEEFYRNSPGSPPSRSQNDITVLKTIPSQSQGPPASLRSNGNGTTPKYPSVSANRPTVKSPRRASPAHLDPKTSLNTAKSSPSLNTQSNSQQSRVKELAKHFNHQSGPGSAPTSNLQYGTSQGLRKTSYQTSTRPRLPSASEAPKTASTSRVNAARSGVGGERQPANAGTRVQKVQSPSREEQSNPTATNTVRTVRSRTQVAGNRQASQSMTNLSPESSPKSPTSVKRKPLLFGEVADGTTGTSAVGYGIPQNVPRRTSDSSFLPVPVSNQNNQSDMEVSPSSPTAWYRGALDEPDANRTPRPFPGHKRSQSESNSTKLGGRDSSPRDVPSPQLRVDTPSKLPIITKRAGNPSGLGPSPHAHNKSPPTSKALPVISAKLQKPHPRPFSPPGRAMTPIRATTPVQRSPNRQAPSPGKLTTGSSTLKAYISAPPPKLSPPLRSSRPRQPISTAATATKQSATVSAAQHNRGSRPARSEALSPKTSSKQPNSDPIDFAAKRAHIRKGVSVRYQEAQRREVKEAAERRAAERKAQMERDMSNSENERPLSSEEEAPQKRSETTLTVNTSLKSPVRSHVAYLKAADIIEPESPILGIPGSFPEIDDVPASAISNVTAITEFEVEAQTEPPQRKDLPILQPPLLSRSAEESSDSHIPYSAQSTEGPDRKVSIDITLNASDVQEDLDTAEDPKSPIENVLANNPYTHSAFYQDSLLSPKATEPSHGFSTFGWNSDDVNRNEILRHGELDLPDYSLESLRQQLRLDDDDDDEHSQGSFENQTYASEAEIQRFDTNYVPSATGIENGYHRAAGTPITDIDLEAPARPFEQHSEQFRTVDSTMRRASHDLRKTESATLDTPNQTSWFAHEEYSPPVPQLPAHDRVPPPPPKIGPQVPPKSPIYSPQASPRSIWDAYKTASSPQTSNAGSGGGVEAAPSPRLDSIPPPLPPPYSPPPPPQLAQTDTSYTARKRSPPPASFHNRRPVSGLNISLNRSTTRESDSRRGSGEDLHSARPSISSPRSNSQMSMDQDSFSRQASVDEQARSANLESTDSESTAKEKRALRQRVMVIRELIDTESLYLKDMNVVEEIYKGTAEACPKLQPSDIKTIFRNTDRVIRFSMVFLDALKLASAAIYTPRSQRSRQSRVTDSSVGTDDTLLDEVDFARDRTTRVGATFLEHIRKMHTVYADFLKGSEQASNRLKTLQSDPAVTVWLNECNQVAKDLTAAWDLDALLVKPLQRITRYPLLLTQIKEATPKDHPDYEDICKVCQALANVLSQIDEQKRRIYTVSQIVGRRRKESDSRGAVNLSTFAKLVRGNKAGPSSSESKEDEAYKMLQDRFGEDFLRLQVVFRDVEFYIRSVREYVNEFLRYLAAIELLVRIGPSQGNWPELESKWTRFSTSMGEMGTHALKDHISMVEKRVLGPFVQLIRAYEHPRDAIKLRNKRRQDHDKAVSLKNQNKKVDDKLSELSNQYEALNETLKLELPRLSKLTENLANICLIRFVNIQADWYKLWQAKMKSVLEENQLPSSIDDIISAFHRDFRYQEERAEGFGIMNGTFLSQIPKDRSSQSTAPQPQSSIVEEEVVYSRNNPPTFEHRSRGLSTTSEHSPSLPTPDFGRSHGGQFTFSPVTATPADIPQFLTRDFPVNGHIKVGSAADIQPTGRTQSGRPSTSRSYDSAARSRPSADSYESRRSPHVPGEFNQWSDAVPNDQGSSRPFSGMFNSAMPPDDVEPSRRSSRTSSQERSLKPAYNVLFLAASLFEFNISEKTEGGFPYLTYQAGEIFDVLGQKGEIWLARNQDDPSSAVGWIWSKHFAQLAMD